MRPAIIRLLLGASVALLAGCAGPRNYAVLLPNPDGSVGKVLVRGTGGEQVLEQAGQGVALDGASAPFAVDSARLQRDFGAALAARPALPEQFMLYFESGGAELTAESRALLTRIIERAKARASVDVSVIGHTDTLGKPEANEALALSRARAMAEQLQQLGLPKLALTIESHGERNLLVPTPDETPEPRNRRVEITLR